MPATYDYSSGSYRVTCTQCDATALTHTPSSRDAENFNGGLVSDIFAWHSGHSRFYTMCRSCTRQRAAARRAAGTRRSANATYGRALGSTRRFGVELEMLFPSRVTYTILRDALEAAGVHGWVVKDDGSLRPGHGYIGIEVASAVLQGEDGMQQLEAACRVFNAHGAKVNRTCGLHVHHEATDLTVDAMKRVAHGWSRNAPMIDGLVSESRRSVNNPYYCQPFGSGDLARVDAATSLADFRRIGIHRYRSMNLSAYGRYGTIEIRQHQGTTSFEKIKTWVLLVQAIVDSAVVGNVPAPRTTMREFLTALGDQLDETARTFCLGRAVEFGAVAV